VKALESTSGIGFGRAACGEFRLPANILSGKIQGVIEPAIADDDFITLLLAASIQLAQVGNDEEPIDISNPDNIPLIGKAFAEYAVAQAQTDEDITGFPVVASVPYGTITKSKM